MIVAISVILGIVIVCFFITLWVGLDNDMSVYEIITGVESSRTRREIEHLLEKVEKLEKESDKQKTEIKKIKGQFIWSDESEEEE